MRIISTTNTKLLTCNRASSDATNLFIDISPTPITLTKVGNIVQSSLNPF